MYLLPRHSEAGTILIELLLVIPALLLVVAGGASVAYGAYAKSALMETSSVAARDLAAQGAAGSLEDGYVYEYREFAETFGLPRAKVRMVVGRDGPVVIAGACYKLPVPIPNVLFGKSSRDLPVFDNDSSPIAELERIMDQSSDLVRKTTQLGRDGKQVVQGVGELWKQLSELAKGSRKLPEFTAGQPMGGPADFDAKLRAACRGDWVVTARAAYMSQGDAPKKGKEKKDEPLQIRVEPEVMNLDMVRPGTQYRVIVKAKSDCNCRLSAEFKSGPSIAKCMAFQATANGGHTTFACFASPKTTPGTYTLRVDCDNGQSGERPMTFDHLGKKS